MKKRSVIGVFVKTKRLTLQPIAQTSLEELTALLMDAAVTRTYMVPDFADREDGRKLAQRIGLLSQNPERYVAGIYLGDRLIGLLNETERSGDTIEVGYAILPPYHNQGYGTEALTGAMDFLLDRGFCRVIAGAFAENAASLRVMEKCGMQRIDYTDEVSYCGKTHRCVYYQAIRP